MNDYAEKTRWTLDGKSKAPGANLIRLDFPTASEADALLQEVFTHGGFAYLVQCTLQNRLMWQMGATVEDPGYMKIVTLAFLPDGEELMEWWEPGDAPFRGTRRCHDHDWDARMFSTDVGVAQALFRDVLANGRLSEASLRQFRPCGDRPPR